MTTTTEKSLRVLSIAGYVGIPNTLSVNVIGLPPHIKEAVSEGVAVLLKDESTRGDIERITEYLLAVIDLERLPGKIDAIAIPEHIPEYASHLLTQRVTDLGISVWGSGDTIH